MYGGMPMFGNLIYYNKKRWISIQRSSLHMQLTGKVMKKLTTIVKHLIICWNAPNLKLSLIHIFHSGAYLLAGAPKIGKSFLVAQIAYHVSTGQEL